MGNIIEILKNYIYQRSENKQGNSRNRSDHPEKLSPNAPSTINSTEGKSKPSTEVKSNTITTAESMEISRITSEKTTVKKELTHSLKENTEHTAEVKKPTQSNQCSEFYLACRNNGIEQVGQLLETMEKDEIDRLEPNGSTALHAACYHGHSKIVELLLEAGADRSIRNKFNCLPFDEAKTDDIKDLFFRITNTNRFVSSTGNIESDLISEDALETAAVDLQFIKSLYENTSGMTPVDKMFKRIESEFINKHLKTFSGIDNVKKYFKKATEEQNPKWIITAYTAETDFYKILNTDIACGATHCQNERRYIISLLRYHQKLNDLSFTGRCFRVIQIDKNILDKYEVNCKFMTKAFSSGSIERKLSEFFLLQKVQSTRIRPTDKHMKCWVMCIYTIKHPRTALYIEEISQYSHEGEILIMPYTVFKVATIHHKATLSSLEDQTLTEIELEECDPLQ